MPLTCLALTLGSVGASSAEINVLSTGVIGVAMKELVPQFEQMSGHTVKVSFQISPVVTKQISGGIASPDMAIITGGGIDALVKEGKITSTSKVQLGETRVAVAVRAGAPQPDIGSVEAVRKMILNAKSLAYTDPATGAPTALHMVELLHRLGVADAVKDKTKLGQGGPIGEMVAKGEAEIGFQQVPELMPVAGISIVGPLPPELQNIIPVTAGILPQAREPAAAQSFIAFLTSPVARAAFKASGIDVRN